MAVGAGVAGSQTVDICVPSGGAWLYIEHRDKPSHGDQTTLVLFLADYQYKETVLQLEQAQLMLSLASRSWQLWMLIVCVTSWLVMC